MDLCAGPRGAETLRCLLWGTWGSRPQEAQAPPPSRGHVPCLCDPLGSGLATLSPWPQPKAFRCCPCCPGLVMLSHVAPLLLAPHPPPPRGFPVPPPATQPLAGHAERCPVTRLPSRVTLTWGSGCHPDPGPVRLRPPRPLPLPQPKPRFLVLHDLVQRSA